MSLTASLLVLLVACQILPPDTSNQFALSLRTEQHVILNGEVRQLRNWPDAYPLRSTQSQRRPC